MTSTGMICPKCSGDWGSHDRNGVQIEECAGCQGVFLDRGELQRLIAAENEYLAKLPPAEGSDNGYHGRHRRGIIEQVFTSAE